MSLGKLASFKGLTLTSHSKGRVKSDLSADMISLPLGDFRHTMHVGRGGEVFGDTSFLSNHGGGEGAESEGSGLDGSDWKASRFFSRTLGHVRRNPQPRLRGESRDLSPPPPPVSPIIKNAVSLPQLPLTTPNGHTQGALFPSSCSCLEQPLYSYGLHSGFVTLPRLTRLNRNSAESSPLPEHRCGSLPDDITLPLTRSDSFNSFTIDLGPPLMTELLTLIDRSCTFTRTSQDPKVEEEEENPSSHVCSHAASLTTTLQRDSVNSRGRSCSPDLVQQHTERGENYAALKRAMPDASLWSPVRVEPIMEAERFQQAADMLARHYGGGGVLKGQWRSSHSSPEEKEGIKV
ncbi:cdc42 effector protein 1b [Brachyhypopomus gauderio]|uniref:cdc42 effector protein 1b n=1 Tax=Brachyhypopomus gauderio TaxID=698409 RepID=UPI0040414515